jgi:hypothetical protein
MTRPTSEPEPSLLFVVTLFSILGGSLLWSAYELWEVLQ